MNDSFLCKNDVKWQNKDIQRQANNKEGTADILRCQDIYGKVNIEFHGCDYKQARYCVCINKHNSSPKDKRKVRIMFFEIEIEENTCH